MNKYIYLLFSALLVFCGGYDIVFQDGQSSNYLIIIALNFLILAKIEFLQEEIDKK